MRAEARAEAAGARAAAAREAAAAAAEAAAAAAAEEAAAVGGLPRRRAAARAAADSRRRRRRPRRTDPGARPLAVGDLVRVRRAVDPPHYGWGGVTHESVGTLLSTGDPNRVTVDMPGRHNAWLAELQELERAAPRELPSATASASAAPSASRASAGDRSITTASARSSPSTTAAPCAPIASPRRSASAATTARGAAVEELERADDAEAPPPPPRRPAEDRARSCGVGDEYEQLVGMGFEAETSLEALVRAARNHRDAERRVAVAVQTLLGA